MTSVWQPDSKWESTINGFFVMRVQLVHSVNTRKANGLKQKNNFLRNERKTATHFPENVHATQTLNGVKNNRGVFFAAKNRIYLHVAFTPRTEMDVLKTEAELSRCQILSSLTGSTRGLRNGNLRCRQCQQSWHPCWQFSVFIAPFLPQTKVTNNSNAVDNFHINSIYWCSYRSSWQIIIRAAFAKLVNFNPSMDKSSHAR